MQYSKALQLRGRNRGCDFISFRMAMEPDRIELRRLRRLYEAQQTIMSLVFSLHFRGFMTACCGSLPLIIDGMAWAVVFMLPGVDNRRPQAAHS